MSLTTLMDKIVQLSTQVRSKPEFRWGVVTGVSPLQVTLDADTAPLAGVPSTLVTGLAVGQRVQCAIQNHRVTVIGVANGGTPVGTILVYAGATTPAGFLLCDGQAVSRTTYASLFTVIGTTYGAGNGTTTFNLPDLGDRTAVGVKAGSAEFGTRGATFGAKTHTLTQAQMPVHNHPIVRSTSGTTQTHVGVSTGDGSVTNRYRLADGAATLITQNAGSGSAHNNIQPSIAFPFIIRF